MYLKIFAFKNVPQSISNITARKCSLFYLMCKSKYYFEAALEDKVHRHYGVKNKTGAFASGSASPGSPCRRTAESGREEKGTSRGKTEGRRERDRERGRERGEKKDEASPHCGEGEVSDVLRRVFHL